MTDGPSWRSLADIPPTPPRLVTIAIRDYDPADELAENQFSDTILSYQAFSERAALQATIEADPLGDVNRIVRLWRQNRDGTQTQLAAALHPCACRPRLKIGKGNAANWQPGHDDPHFGWIGMFDAVWYVEVDGVRVLELPYHDVYEPLPPAPRPPLRRRVRAAVKRRARGLADAIAGRLGYTRTGECDCEQW
ncbi:MAG TPA: hypothetical protein VGG84_10295 [Gemmatimonadaceae bacterium]|jgi:hypothetical protein